MSSWAPTPAPEDDDDECGSGQPLWWLGIVLGLLGSICINTGNNFQSLGMHCDEDPTQSPTWRLGTVIFVSGALLNFASYAFAAQSMLASLEAIQFVTNILFSKFMLKKSITTGQYTGTAMICVGTIIAVLHSSREELCATARDLVRNYHNLKYQIFLASTLVFGVLLQGTHAIYQKRDLPFANTVLPVTYAAFSALFGTQSVVQAKCLAELLQGEPTTFFLHWFTYVVVVAWVCLVAVWLYRMNEALSLYDPIFIIPLLQIDFILFAIVAGGLYFREFDDFTARMWIGFTVGIAVVFAGLFMLAPTDAQAEEFNSVRRNKIAPVDDCALCCDDPVHIEEPIDAPIDHEGPVASCHVSPKRRRFSESNVPSLLSCLDHDVPKRRMSDSLAAELTPRSKTLPSDASGHAVIRKSQTRPINYVTSIAVQFNKNDLDYVRTRRPSFDRRPEPTTRRRSSFDGPPVGAPAPALRGSYQWRSHRVSRLLGLNGASDAARDDQVHAEAPADQPPPDAPAPQDDDDDHSSSSDHAARELCIQTI